MKTIWKYQLETTDYQEISLPEGSQVLCVQEQGDRPHLWALVDPSLPPRKLRLRIFGTGYRVESSENLHYLGTYQMALGALIFHVFEDKS